MAYNWKALTNEDISGLIRNGGIIAGYDADFSRALVEETAHRIEHAAQLEAERDEWKRLHRMLAIAGIELVHERDSYIADLRRYQAEREQLLARIEGMAAELKQAQAELNHYHRLQTDIDMGVIVLEYPREEAQP